LNRRSLALVTVELSGRIAMELRYRSVQRSNTERTRFDFHVLHAPVLAAVAITASLVPLSPTFVERWYSLGLYPRVQTVLTSFSNLIPISFIDVSVGVLLTAGVTWLLWRARRDGWRRAARRAALALVSGAAALYLLFLLTWGLNYRRIPVERKLAYDPARVTREAAVAFGRVAVQRVNDGYGAAHSDVAGPALEHAFFAALAAIGHDARVVTGRPKHSLLSVYFRRAAIDGMTNPLFLDIVINPDVLPMERPEVLAHEWAHLAGYADEAEANFIAWLTCVRGDPMAQYSGWLSLYQHLWAALPREDRRALSASLAEGPRADLRAMAARHARASPLVQRAQRGVYDVYLRANRVEEGIARYSAVARLVLGSEFDAGWTPRLRQF
jgi:hypothetical protein